MESTRARLSSDEEQLLSSLPISQPAGPEWYKSAKVHHNLSTWRMSTFIRILTLLDCITTSALWLSGGNTDYLISSITNYTFNTSVFDLVIFAFVRWMLLLILLDVAEATALKRRKYGSHFSLPSSATVSLVISISVTMASWLVSLIKMVWIINNSTLPSLHNTYEVLVFFAPSVGFVETVLVLVLVATFKRMILNAEKQFFDENGRRLDKDGQVIEKKATLRRLFSLLSQKEGTMIAGGIACLLITSAVSIAAPYFFGQVVDAAQTSMSSLNKMILILFLIYLAYGVAGMFRAFLFTLAGQKLVARLRTELFAAIMRQDVEFFDNNRTGELTNRLASDTEVIQEAITVNVSMLLRNLINVCGSLVVMFALDPPLTGILLAVVPIISIAAVQYGKFMKDLRKKFQDKLAEASTIAEECLSSIRTVKAFNGEEKGVSDYEINILKSYEVAKKLAWATGIFTGWISIAAFGAICLAMWYGGKLVFEGKLSVGILTSFLVYTVTIAANLAVISSLYGSFMQAVGASERMFNIIDIIPKIRATDPVNPESFKPVVEFKDVSFIYPSRLDHPVLKNISLSINPGQVVALVGPSGGGKSTIVSLIERFYDCNQGSIFISGVDIKRLDPLWFRSKISLVSQEPTLFACSIKDNISYGIDASHEQVVEAAKQANAHNFIENFPEGYDTLVGERGVKLSGGQKQRVAIARSLITDPAILLLDEATSALDAESEQLVQEAIDRAMQQRTVLIIAHRLSTVRDADLVIVIDNGEIAEQGTHDELVSRDGVYKKLVLKQLEAGTINQESD